jgi:hypothetical protein
VSHTRIKVPSPLLWRLQRRVTGILCDLAMIPLTRIGATLEPVTIGYLETIGVTTGGRCSEVRAGAGSIATWLCQRVGAHGQVVATDLTDREEVVSYELAHPIPDCATPGMGCVDHHNVFS